MPVCQQCHSVDDVCCIRRTRISIGNGIDVQIWKYVKLYTDEYDLDPDNFILFNQLEVKGSYCGRKKKTAEKDDECQYFTDATWMPPVVIIKQEENFVLTSQVHSFGICRCTMPIFWSFFFSWKWWSGTYCCWICWNLHIWSLFMSLTYTHFSLLDLFQG